MEAKKKRAATAKTVREKRDKPVRDREKAILEKVWSRKTALEGLKRIFETALEGARVEVRDENGALVEVKFNPSAANAATKAVETANRMLGYSEPNEADPDAETGIAVELGEAEELSL